MFGVRVSRGGTSNVPRVDPRKIDGFFRQYAKSAEEIPIEGTEKLCTDLGFSTLDPVALVLCYHCGTKHMGIFTKEEFQQGMTQLGVADLYELKSKVDDMRAQLIPGHPLAKKIYTNVFVLSLDGGQKQLAKEMACELWKLLLSLYGNIELADLWIQYVEELGPKTYVSKDVWNMVFDLMITCTADLSDYDEDGAWPVMIDDFVAYTKQLKNANQQG